MANNTDDAWGDRMRRWWADWRAENYTWDGLAEKPWVGWAWSPTTQTAYESDRAPKQLKTVPATLQHYWWDQQDSLVSSPDGTEVYTVVHLPLNWADGSATDKAARADLVLATIKSRLAAGGEVRFEDRFSLSGADHRAQLAGAVIISTCQPASDDFPVIRARFDRACFLEGLPWPTGQEHQPVTVEHARFHNAAFSGDTWFENVAFSGNSIFTAAIFSGTARFSGAAFAGDVWFQNAAFSGTARFASTGFKGDAWFNNAAFNGNAGFDRANFAQDGWFNDAVFSGGAGFREATFTGDARFHNAVFSGGAGFRKVAFTAYAGFLRSRFAGDARFHEAIFSGYGRFDGATFSGDASFDNATFQGNAGFHRTTFHGTGWFNEIAVLGEAGFGGATFVRDARFRDAVFSGVAGFDTVTFSSDAAFDKAMFEGHACFRNAAFSGKAGFQGAAFAKNAEFQKAAFSAEAGFDDARFEGPAVFSGSGVPVTGQAERRGLSLVTVSEGRQEGEMFRPGELLPLARSAFPRFSARRAHFMDDADFGDRAFLTPADFSGATFFGLAGFHGSRLHQRINFHGTRFRVLENRQGADDSRYEDIEASFRTLKQAMEDTRARRMESLFFKLELLARRRRKTDPLVPRWERVLSRAYGLTADYGDSVVRPLGALAVLWFGFGLAYWPLAAMASGAEIVATSDWFTIKWRPLDGLGDALQYSLGRTSLFGAFSGADGAWPWLEGWVNRGSIRTWSGLIRILAMSQSVMAVILTFLVALAIRRKFQIT